jgi:hypothetical protein
MVLISGYYTNTSKDICDSPSVGGFHALNMGQESYEKENGLWTGLSNVTQYRVPNNVAVQIGGGYVDIHSGKVCGEMLTLRQCQRWCDCYFASRWMGEQGPSDAI